MSATLHRALLATALLAGCAPAAPSPAPAPEAPPVAPSAPPATDGGGGEALDPLAGRLPAIPPRTGALEIDVVYPAEGAALTTRDSTFVFGSVGTGAATLRIGGRAVEVAPNGAFLAFLHVPPDGVYRLEAEGDGTRATLRRTVRVPPAPAALPRDSAVIVAGSVEPRGVVTGHAGETVTVRFRGTPGGTARVLLPDGTAVPLRERVAVERPAGFGQDGARAAVSTEYGGALPLRPLYAAERAVGAPALVTNPGRIGSARVELVVGDDTARAPLPLSVGVLAPGAARVAVAEAENGSGRIVGRAVAGSGTPYFWSFPDGTRLLVTGERDGDLRVRLAADQSVWVTADDVRLLPETAPADPATVGAVRLSRAGDTLDVRLSLSAPVPAEVRLDGTTLEIHVYGAESRTNWLYYPEGADDFVRRAAWSQPADDRYVLTLELAEAPWGWRTELAGPGDLRVRVRRAPRVDPARPLRGMRIAVDAGHPPGGAIGPTRLTEAEANLAIAKRLVRRLEEAGAVVLETRPDTAAVALGARPAAAEAWNADVLVSVHNNAFPDGVDPFARAGTTSFHNAPQSLALARAMQAALVRELGLRDLGIAWADLALVRTTWMPSVLTESMFLMVPAQEAALRDPAVHERIARAHLRALETFLRDAARR